MSLECPHVYIRTANSLDSAIYACGWLCDCGLCGGVSGLVCSPGPGDRVSVNRRIGEIGVSGDGRRRQRDAVKDQIGHIKTHRG